MIPNPCIEVQTSPEARPSVPSWFAEVVLLAHDLTTKGQLEAFARAESVSYEDVSAGMNPSIFWPC